MMLQRRGAVNGELCTCGRHAVTVYISGGLETGYCGVAAGPAGPCVFCGAAQHAGRCPDYRLRPIEWVPSVEFAEGTHDEGAGGGPVHG